VPPQRVWFLSRFGLKMGIDFLRPGLKTGVGNGIFWSEIGSGFGDTGGTPPPKISTKPPPWGQGLELSGLFLVC